MHLLSVSLVLVAGLTLAWAEVRSPKIYVYTEKPLEYGKSNKVLCHVRDFHPPNCLIKLQKNDEELLNAEQNDLVFQQDWNYLTTKHADVVIDEGDKIQCVVQHNSQPAKTIALTQII